MNIREIRRKKKAIIIPATGVIVSILIVSILVYNYLSHQQVLVTDTTQREHDTTSSAEKERGNNSVIISLPGAMPLAAIPEDYNQPFSIWTIVNKNRPIPLEYTPSALKIPDVATRSDKSKEEQSIRSDIEVSIKEMFDVAKTSGHSLMIGSAYRSAALQKYYFDHYAQVAGEAEANKYSARPGQSEHQTGLAIDITSTSLECYLDECFANTPDGQWLAANAHKFGFTLRYPKNKEAITGYQFEPWHYRYVGVDLATALQKSSLTLEEAWPYLEDALKKLKQNGTI